MGMAYTQAQLDELEAAIASGIQTVEYQGPPARRITYQSLEAMENLRARMIRELGSGSAPSYRLASTRTGLNGARDNDGGIE